MACNSLCKCEECKNITNGETSEPFHNSVDTMQANVKFKNKEFNEKLEGLMSMVSPSQKQSMLEFVYYLLSWLPPKCFMILAFSMVFIYFIIINIYEVFELAGATATWIRGPRVFVLEPWCRARIVYKILNSLR